MTRPGRRQWFSGQRTGFPPRYDKIRRMTKLAAGTTACLGVALAGYAVRGRSSTFFGPSVHRGVSCRRSVALTFDDGPSESTPALLDLLARHRVAATFFQCGANVERLPEVARAVGEAGHEIGNHSYSHARFYLRSAAFIERALDFAPRVIEQITGVSPRLLRVPFGARWFGLRAAQRRLRLLNVMWTELALDWKLSAERIVDRVAPRAGPGSIICLHDGRELQANPDIRETLRSLERLIPLLCGRGFAFETVSQLLCPTN
jgi:peptidoglycan-N-acetylglucosamine deacetylase